MFSTKQSVWLIWGLCLILASGLASCRNHSSAGRAGESQDMRPEKDQRVLTPGENGRTFEITVGEIFQVSLPENPTTGYQWSVYNSGTPLISLEKEEYVIPENNPARPIMGGGGTKLLTFKAAKPGETEPSLRLRRSWEAESEFVDYFSIKLKIVEPHTY